MKIKPLNLIIDTDWDQVVEETYKRPYVLWQQGDCRQPGSIRVVVPKECREDEMFDSIPESTDCEKMGVKFTTWLARDPKKPLIDQEHDFDLSFWWERNFYPDVQAVANDLHKKGLLPAGEYSIKINW